MPLEQVLDHAQRMAERLPSQFQDQPNIAKLVAIQGARYQAIEDMLWSLLSGRSIFDAVGAQLAAVATAVGTERPASGLVASDEEAFRAFVQAKIVANGSEGEPERLIGIAGKLGSEATQVVEQAYFFEEKVAIRVAMQGDPTTTWPVAMELMRQAAPAGVRIILSGNEVWAPDQLWGDDDLWPETRYTDGTWGPDGLWGASALWGGDLIA